MTDRNDDLFKDPSFIRGMTQKRLSRRDVFKYAGIGAGALSMSSILAACGSSSSTVAASRIPAMPSPTLVSIQANSGSTHSGMVKR